MDIISFTIPDCLFYEEDLNDLGILQNDPILISAALDGGDHIRGLKNAKSKSHHVPYDSSKDWDIVSSIGNVVKYRVGIVCAFVYEDFRFKQPKLSFCCGD